VSALGWLGLAMGLGGFDSTLTGQSAAGNAGWWWGWPIDALVGSSRALGMMGVGEYGAGIVSLAVLESGCFFAVWASSKAGAFADDRWRARRARASRDEALREASLLARTVKNPKQRSARLGRL
jgi:hypothetical protein